MTWKHEEPIEREKPDDSVSLPETLLDDDSSESEPGPALPIFKPFSSVGSNDRQASGALDSSQEGSSESGSTETLKDIVQSRPKRKVSSNPISPASKRPQRISKKQRSRQIRRKAKK
jgi:hypothetical protein